MKKKSILLVTIFLIAIMLILCSKVEATTKTISLNNAPRILRKVENDRIILTIKDNDGIKEKNIKIYNMIPTNGRKI